MFNFKYFYFPYVGFKFKIIFNVNFAYDSDR